MRSELLFYVACLAASILALLISEKTVICAHGG